VVDTHLSSISSPPLPYPRLTLLGTSNQILVERGDELEVLRAAVAGAREGIGRLVVIEGAAGIGKTALLAQTRALAAEADFEVLSARGHELEREFAFGVARQLFEAPVARAGAERQEQLLDGAAGLARPLLGLSRRRGGDQPDRPSARAASEAAFTVSHGFYWLTANLAEAGPLMLSLDDAQYSDRSSLQCIAYLAARCSELPVLLAITVRSDEAREDLLTALRSAPESIVVRPRTLSEEGVGQVVRERFGDADPDFCEACARASAGNPFLLGELLTQLSLENLPPTAANSAYVDGVNPESVGRVVLARLERLGPNAMLLANAVAVFERASLRDAGQLAGLETSDAVTAADALLAAGIISAEPLVYVHPLLRLAVYEQLNPAQLAEDHRRAAQLLAAGGAPSVAVGSHLLRAAATGDANAVGLLRMAAGEALGGGDLAAAITLLRRALAEPPAQESRGAVLADLGRMEALAHDPTAVEHLGAALGLIEDPVAKVSVACALGELLVWGGGRSVEAYEMLSGVLATLGEDLPAGLRAPMDARLVPRVAPRLDELRELATAAGSAGRSLKIFDACWHAQTAGIESGWRERMDEAIEDHRFVAEETGGAPIVVYATLVLVLTDEVSRAEALLADIRADARERGSIVSHAIDLAWGAFLRMRLGDLRAAAADAQTALSLTRRIRASWLEVWLVACLAETLREQGELDAASRLIESVPLESAVGTAAGLHGLMARARVRNARGERELAISDLRLAGENVIVNNPSFVPWRAELASMLASSDPQEARELVEISVARARELGQPRGIGIALRAQARVLGGDAGRALLDESVEALRGSPARLQLAHSLAEQGAAQRRAGQRTAAREPLREALALAQQLGADALAETVQEELVVSGARPRRQVLSGPDSLTPSERRVAELAAAGMQNREIAQALFVTTKTVGTHLTHIYQKLDLSGPQARESLIEHLPSGRS
jgi:DNA-binding CsgD family transcriptional regulator